MLYFLGLKVVTSKLMNLVTKSTLWNIWLSFVTGCF